MSDEGTEPERPPFDVHKILRTLSAASRQLAAIVEVAAASGVQPGSDESWWQTELMRVQVDVAECHLDLERFAFVEEYFPSGDERLAS